MCGQLFCLLEICLVQQKYLALGITLLRPFAGGNSVRSIFQQKPWQFTAELLMLITDGDDRTGPTFGSSLPLRLSPSGAPVNELPAPRQSCIYSCLTSGCLTLAFCRLIARPLIYTTSWSTNPCLLPLVPSAVGRTTLAYSFWSNDSNATSNDLYTKLFPVLLPI